MVQVLNTYMHDVRSLHQVKYMCACILKASVFLGFSDMYKCLAFSFKATGSCWTTTINHFWNLIHQYLNGLAQQKDLIKDSWNPEFIKKNESELIFTVSQIYSFAK